MLTLFAGFVLSFSKIFCDWDFEASAAMFAVPRKFEDLGVSLGSVKKVSGGKFSFRRCSDGIYVEVTSGPHCDWDLVSCRFTKGA